MPQMSALGPITIWEPLGFGKPTRCPFDVKFHGGARGWHPFLPILKQKQVMEGSWHRGASSAKPLQKEFLKFESVKCLGFCHNHHPQGSHNDQCDKNPIEKMQLSSLFYLGRSQLSIHPTIINNNHSKPPPIK